MKRKWSTSMLDVETAILILFRRPDFVAVLGVLSKEEIEAYATRTNVFWEARKRRYRQYARDTLSIQPPLVPKIGAEASNPSTPGRSQVKGKGQGKREDLGVAGIGGAAVSLLNVLSEAAEGL